MQVAHSAGALDVKWLGQCGCCPQREGVLFIICLPGGTCYGKQFRSYSFIPGEAIMSFKPRRVMI